MNVFAIISSVPRTQIKQEESHDNPSKQLVKSMHVQNPLVDRIFLVWIYADD
jgi:hypothetical protein